MMNEMLLELLRSLAADGWEVSDEETEGWEFYFIGHKLDQSRTRSTRHTTVRVYKKSGDVYSYSIDGPVSTVCVLKIKGNELQLESGHYEGKIQ